MPGAWRDTGHKALCPVSIVGKPGSSKTTLLLMLKTAERWTSVKEADESWSGSGGRIVKLSVLESHMGLGIE